MNLRPPRIETDAFASVGADPQAVGSGGAAKPVEEIDAAPQRQSALLRALRDVESHMDKVLAHSTRTTVPGTPDRLPGNPPASPPMPKGTAWDPTLASLHEALDRETSLRAHNDTLTLRLKRADAALSAAVRDLEAAKRGFREDGEALRTSLRQEHERALAEATRPLAAKADLLEARLAGTSRLARLAARTVRHAAGALKRAETRGRALRADEAPAAASPVRRIRPAVPAKAVDAHRRAIERSRLFHADFYLGQIPGGLPKGVDPLRHYVTCGWRAGLDPNPIFDLAFYRLTNPDLGDDVDPLIHYIEQGSAALRDPHPMFHTRHFAARCPVAKPDDTTWLRHFLRLDVPAPSPHPLFDAGAYAASAGLGQTHAAVALLHYLMSGWKAGLAFSPLFDAHHYRGHAGAASMEAEPYGHYRRHGLAAGHPPHPLFDLGHYLAQRKLDANRHDPLVDYVEAGEAAGASPNAFFDPAFYRDRFMPKGRQGTALAHYITEGSAAGHDPHPDFDAALYRHLRGGAKPQGATLLEDFLGAGLFEIPWPDLPQFSPGAPDAREAAAPEKPAALRAEMAPLPMRHYPGKRPAREGLATVLLVAHSAGEHLFGGERSFLDMLDGLAHVPANVVVAVPRNVPVYTNAIRALCQDVFVFDYRWWRKGEDSSPPVRAAFRQIIAEKKIAAVHANTIMLREPLQAARDCGVPAVVHVRELIGQDAALQELIGQAPDEIVAETKRRSDWIVGNSDTTAEAFRKPGRTHVIRNVTDTEAMDIPRRAEHPTIDFGLISSNIPKKGLLDLVQIARLSEASAPRARFLVIGPETELVRDLRHRQTTGEVGRNVVFAGYAASPKDAIAQVDVVLSLSHFAESFGRTVLEAMAARRPVIAYEWGAIPELVEHGRTGYLVPFRKPELALGAVRGFCDDRRLIAEMGDRGRQAAVARYGLESYRKAFARAYAEILPPARDGARPSLDAPLIRPARREGLKVTEAHLRLAYFCWHFPVPSETFVLSELEHLVRTGVDVIVFCRQSPHKAFQPGFPITYERVDSPERLAQRLRETGRTMVHAHFTYPTVTDMVWPACEAAGVPFTFMAHAQDIFRHENDRRNRLAEIGAAPLCRTMFTLSRFHLDFVTERGFPRHKVVINPNAVDASRFSAAQVENREARTTRRIVAIHRYVEKKGLELLIRAAALLGDLGVRIDIFGYGEREAAYRALVADLGLDNVVIHGPLSHDQVVETMRHADLFASPSVRAADGDMDGIPTSIVESMAAGLPVLATAVAGIPDLVVEGVTGLVAEPTPESVAQAIRRFYAMPDLKIRTMIDTARRQALSRHDAVRTTRILERVWRNRTIDIVVVAWNNLPELKAVLERAVENTALPYHLIVCDNHSTREPVAPYLDAMWERHDRITVIHNHRNTMVGPGTNLALAQGTSDVAVYLCSKEGMSFRHGWEAAFVHAFEEQPGAGLIGTIGYSPTYLHGAQYPTGIPLFGKFRNPAFATDNPTRIFGHVQGGLFGIRRAMVEAIGGFSEDVPHDYTDVEYSFYAESRGWTLGEAPGILALFNKSRPTLSQRFDDEVVIAHPVLLDQIEPLSGVAEGRLRHCNICDWFGPEFEPEASACPHCGASPTDRSLQRWLGESRLMFRRLPALAAGLDGHIQEVWSKQFQGPRLSVADLLAELRAKGRLSNRPDGFAVSILRYEALAREAVALIAKEVGRLLSADGVALFQIEEGRAGGWRAQRDILVEAMERAGFVPSPDVTYANRALEFSHVPMQVFTRAR